MKRYLIALPAYGADGPTVTRKSGPKKRRATVSGLKCPILGDNRNQRGSLKKASFFKEKNKGGDFDGDRRT
jgi:hypothetical protein